MRLINTSTLLLHEFSGNDVPLYAIFSHRWQDLEVTFMDLQSGKAPDRAGWRKIMGCCSQAARDGWEYVVSSCKVHGFSVQYAVFTVEIRLTQVKG